MVGTKHVIPNYSEYSAKITIWIDQAILGKHRIERMKITSNKTSYSGQYIRTSLLNGDFVLAFERKRFFSTAHMTFVVNSSSYKVSIYIMCHSGRFAQNVNDNNYHTLILLVIKRQIRSPFNWFSTTLLQTADFFVYRDWVLDHCYNRKCALLLYRDVALSSRSLFTCIRNESRESFIMFHLTGSVKSELFKWLDCTY